jgi:hypothetical protein
MALLNGVEYGWCDIKVTLLGRRLEGIVAVDYEMKQEKKNIYGRGSNPVSRGRGNKEYEASITLTGKEYAALEASIPKTRTIMDIPPFRVDISYAPEDGSNLVKNDALVDVEFTNVKKDAKQGDESMTIELKLIVGKIEYNV